MSVMIPVLLDIPDVRLLSTHVNAEGELIIQVESTLKGTCCHQCGEPIKNFHGYDRAIELRHLPVWDQRVYVKICPKRYRCPHCEGRPTTTQRCAWYEPNSPHTKAFEQSVLRLSVNSTVCDAARQAGVNKDAVQGIIEREIAVEVDWSQFERLGTIGIDEIALTKGHNNFVAVITSRTGEGKLAVLAVLPDRLKATVKAFLTSIPAPLKATIECVCTDMYKGYINAAYEALPGVTVVVDRFHVAPHYHESVDALRQQELKRLQHELSEHEYEPLKGLMWVVRRDWWDLGEDQQHQLLPLFKHSPVLKQAYGLREVLTGIFNVADTKAQAEQALEAWCEQVRQSGLKCFEGFLTTVDNWKHEITNYFLDRQTSGFVEGLNNKLKLIKRRCYGLESVRTLFQRIWLDLQGPRLFGLV